MFYTWRIVINCKSGRTHTIDYRGHEDNAQLVNDAIVCDAGREVIHIATKDKLIHVLWESVESYNIVNVTEQKLVGAEEE